MSGEMVHVDQDEIPAARKKTAVWKHPDRAQIEALLARGKTAWWISAWLEEHYPTEDVEPAEAKRNKGLALSDEVLAQYREDWMPEAAPGVDVVHDEIEDLIGRRFPGSVKGPEYELELLEMTMNTAQHLLAQGLDADAKLKLGVSETTLAAHGSMVDTIRTSIELKQRLGVEGYEAQPDHHVFESRNLNVHLDGRLNARTGELEPGEPGRVDALMELLKAPPERAREILDAAASLKRDAPADVVDSPGS